MMKLSLEFHIQIFQRHVPQVEKIFNVAKSSSFPIFIGPNDDCELQLPFVKAPIQKVFIVRNGQVFALIEPKMEGYIHNGKRYCDIKDHIVPHGFLGNIATANDPLELELSEGARGIIKYYDFEIIFKVIRSSPAKKSNKPPLLQGALFQTPATDSRFEKSSLYISLTIVLSIFFPAIFWLMNLNPSTSKGIEGVPSHVIKDLIHPDNYRLLPFLFSEEFKKEEATDFAIKWVTELSLRWYMGERGQQYKSHIAYLDLPVVKSLDTEKIKRNWTLGIQQRYQELEEKRLSSSSPRYFSFLKSYPVFETSAAGKTLGTMLDQASRYLVLMQRMDQGIKKLLVLEHLFLQEHFKQFEVEKREVVAPLFTGKVLGPQPDDRYYRDFENYKAVERYARDARTLRRKNLTMFGQRQGFEVLTPHIRAQSNDLLFLEGVTQADAFPVHKSKEDVIFAFWNNVKYSTGELIIPGLPPPRPTIDRNELAFVLYSRKEEIKACYDYVLSRHPGLEGKMMVEFLISEKGKAESIKIFSTSLNNNELEQCIKKRLSLWLFPKPKGGSISMTYPFVFKVAK